MGMSAATSRAGVRSPDRRPDRLDQGVLLAIGLHAMTLEIIAADADIGVEPARVLMEMQEGAGFAIEHAARLFAQPIQRPHPSQERLQTVEGFGAGVSQGYRGPLPFNGSPTNRRMNFSSAMSSMSSSPSVSP
jgi:hypothetical protein